MVILIDWLVTVTVSVQKKHLFVLFKCKLNNNVFLTANQVQSRLGIKQKKRKNIHPQARNNQPQGEGMLDDVVFHKC